MGERRGISPAMGGSSLLVIFAVLCLTVFALLGLSTAQADKRLSDASAQAVADYYAADCQAETLLAQLRRGQVPAGVLRQGDHYIYRVPISDVQTLEVEVRLTETDYTVLRWQAVSTAAWSPDESLELWDGTLPG